MPDRYGNPRPGRDEPIDLDPPPDYKGAAKRGRTALNALMGWNTPHNPQTSATEPHSPSNTHPSNTQPPPKTPNPTTTTPTTTRTPPT